MHEKRTYGVLVDCRCGETTHRQGSTVELTDKQAKYLLLSKKVAPVLVADKASVRKSTKQKKGINNA
ncbi:MAG: hypothetical protein OEZ39_07460 [Gammaproteobacteria bacterium]|nr:hypothetical protein [Gammaproteobacteria bacterium]MDH5651695.1 hypothetical protein [Gammaproteobacteria bacterium]